MSDSRDEYLKIPPKDIEFDSGDMTVIPLLCSCDSKEIIKVDADGDIWVHGKRIEQFPWQKELTVKAFSHLGVKQ